MKVLLYSEQLDRISKSGLGKSIQHQMKALELAGIDYTLDPEEDFDVLHINTYFYESMAFARKCRREGKPIVYHAHSNEEDFKNSFIFSNQLSPLFKQWLLQCYNLGDVLITPTPYAKKVLESYPVKRQIMSISNGIDLKKFAPIPNARQNFLKKYAYQENDFIVMGVGLYLERKGILDFVELAKRMPDIQFIWFGYTKLTLVPLKIREAVETQLPNLRFAGYVDNKEIVQALQATDLYIFPTLEETEGIPAVEACAAGADFIVRDIPVFDEWLEHGENVYKAKTVDEFQQLIEAFRYNELPSLKEEAYKVAQDRDLLSIGHQLGTAYELAQKVAERRTQSK